MTKVHWNFLVDETSATNGNEWRNLNCGQFTTICLSVDTAATAYQFVIEAKGVIGDYVAIYGWDEANKTLVSSVTHASGKMITVDATAKEYVRVRLVSTDAAISVSGKVVE